VILGWLARIGAGRLVGNTPPALGCAERG
jgi:hypothetical protein